MAKKENIEPVKNQVSTSMTNLGVDGGGAEKSEGLVSTLADGWKSPKATDYAESVRTAVTDSAGLWSSLSEDVEAAYNSAED